MTQVVSRYEKLREALTGSVVTPDDPGYDDARQVWNGDIDRRPAVVAYCRTAEDVARAVSFAREASLEMSVRSGGAHSTSGMGVGDAGIVVDVSRMNEVAVDPQGRRATVGGGALQRDVDAATQAHGLAVPLGEIGHTGVGGIATGGGMGWLTRQHGLTSDNLLSAQVVLADGRIVRAAPDENPDLFWAIRGGGGNFGVVTSFEFRAHPVSIVHGGPTFWAIEDTEEVLKAYRDWIGTAPREVGAFFCWHTVPPGPPFPEELHLRQVCGIVWCHTGSAEQAAADMAPMLAVGTPLMHGVQEMPMPMMNSAFDALYPPGDQWYWRADFQNRIADEAVAANQEWNEKMPTWKCGSHMYPIDGAAHDVGPTETPWAFRDANWSQVIISVDPDPAGAGGLRDWAVGYWDAIHPYSAGGAYVNFMMDEGQERVQATYGANYDRLASTKAKYDPDNVFSVNQNIRPKG